MIGRQPPTGGGGFQPSPSPVETALISGVFA